MDRVEADATPTEEWQQSLNAACNRLSTHYLNLLRSASSVSALQEEGRSDPRAGGGRMKRLHDPPPPPLAANVALSTLQCQLAAENLCVSASHLLSLIRILRLSLLIMDEETIAAEEEYQSRQAHQITERAMALADQAEIDWIRLRNCLEEHNNCERGDNNNFNNITNNNSNNNNMDG